MIIINKWKKIFLDTNTYVTLKNRKSTKYLVYKTYNSNLVISSLFHKTTIKIYSGIRFIPIKIDSFKFGVKCKNFLNNV